MKKLQKQGCLAKFNGEKFSLLSDIKMTIYKCRCNHNDDMFDDAKWFWSDADCKQLKRFRSIGTCHEKSHKPKYCRILDGQDVNVFVCLGTDNHWYWSDDMGQRLIKEKLQCENEVLHNFF